MPDGNFNLIWIPVFPLMGALFNLLFGRVIMRIAGERLGKEIVHLVAIAAVAFSCFFTISVVNEAMLGQKFERVVQSVYPWIVSGETIVGFDLLLDPLSAVMCTVVSGVGLLIHIFSVGYMAKDPGYARYFAYLNLFTGSMLILVLGKSLVVTFIGWEGVGLCSYLLIGFWFTDEAKASAGRKAFIMNRIGDFGFLLGMFLIYSITHSLDFDAIRSAASTGFDSLFVADHTKIYGVTIATAATLLLFLGCTGKSAQIPLYTWLPDAMAGPTPVSALIHAATMVTAGVYLIVRLNFLFALAPMTMAIIAVIGAATAFYAATIGITQNDIKKVLAYSTVSQLGYMFVAAGVGAWTAAIFHLVTHAFFKACLFLGSGAVIEACHHNQDIRQMGQLRKKMPVTAGTFLISTLAIAGIVPLSGFFSKDEILISAYTFGTAWSPALNWVCFGLGLVAAACTAFYMVRVYALTFEGKFRGDHHTWTHHVKEYWIMSLPLVILAAGAALGGLLNVPHAYSLGFLPEGVLHEWLAPTFEVASRFTGEFRIGLRDDRWFPTEFFVEDGHLSARAEYIFAALSTAVVVSSGYFAWRLYRDGPSTQVEQWVKGGLLGLAYRASLAKYWVDEIYAALIVRPVRFIAGICYQAVDQLIVDGLGVSGVSGTVSVIGNGVRTWHNGNLRRYLLLLLLGVGLLLASVYGNPTISRFGPSTVHPVDGGGLRPTLGSQPVRIKIWGVDEFRVGPQRLGPGRAPAKPDPGPRRPAPRPPQKGAGR